MAWYWYMGLGAVSFVVLSLLVVAVTSVWSDHKYKAEQKASRQNPNFRDYDVVAGEIVGFGEVYPYILHPPLTDDKAEYLAKQVYLTEKKRVDELRRRRNAESLEYAKYHEHVLSAYKALVDAEREEQ